jgi:hypothetical protein
MNSASLVLAVALAANSSISEQARPNFTGNWSMDEARSVSATQEAFVGPVVFEVTHTDRLLTVNLKRGPKAYTLSFPIVERPPSGPPDTVPTARAYWLQSRLITELAQNISGQTLITREEWNMLADGRELVVERMVRVEHGYTVRGARSYNTARDTFVKTSP